MIKKELSGIFVIDGLFQAYSSHDFLIECPIKSHVPRVLVVKSKKRKKKLSCQNKIPTTSKIVFVPTISKCYVKSMTP